MKDKLDNALSGLNPDENKNKLIEEIIPEKHELKLEYGVQSIHVILNL